VLEIVMQNRLCGIYFERYLCDLYRNNADFWQGCQPKYTGDVLRYEKIFSH